MAKLIFLTQDKSTIVDDDCYLLLSQHKWRAIRSISGLWYAIKSEPRIAGQKRNHTLMHRYLMSAPVGLQVDHKNGNSLDNRKENLRLCSHQQNQFNKGAYASNKTGAKGVQMRGTRFRVQIQANKKNYVIGHFETISEAISQYNIASNLLHGEFSRQVAEAKK